MGDRVSIQFQKDDVKSVVLFSHWGGMEFVQEAKEYAERISSQFKDSETYPLHRLEPGIVMVDFIRELTETLDEVDSDYYLEVDEFHGDNSDNGHHIIILTKNKENDK